MRLQNSISYHAIFPNNPIIMKQVIDIEKKCYFALSFHGEL